MPVAISLVGRPLRRHALHHASFALPPIARIHTDVPRFFALPTIALIHPSVSVYIGIALGGTSDLALTMRLASAGAEAATLEEQLLEACRQGQADRARQLLDGGAEPACHDEQGVTPLMLAAESGNEAAVAALLGK